MPDKVVSCISLYINRYNNLSDIFIMKYRQGHFQNASFAIFIKYYIARTLKKKEQRCFRCPRRLVSGIRDENNRESPANCNAELSQPSQSFRSKQ